MKFRNSSSNIEIRGEQLTLDTGLSYAMAPPEDLQSIAKQVKQIANMSCAKEGGGDLDLFECDCTKEQYKKLSPLQLKIENKYFNLPVEAWMSYVEHEKVNTEDDDPAV